jgi:hypothetical protein
MNKKERALLTMLILVIVGFGIIIGYVEFTKQDYAVERFTCFDLEEGQNLTCTISDKNE